MVAFKNDAQQIEQQVGSSIRTHEELEAAVLSGKVEEITPEGHWLVAWFGDGRIEALEFCPVSYCRERWALATEGVQGPVTIVSRPGETYVMVHPPQEPTS